jgi:hypothetical protein
LKWRDRGKEAQDMVKGMLREMFCMLLLMISQGIPQLLIITFTNL